MYESINRHLYYFMYESNANVALLSREQEPSIIIKGLLCLKVDELAIALLQR